MEEKNKNNLLAVKISLIVIVLLIIGGLLIFRLGNRVERMSKVEAYTYNLLISIKIYESTYGFLPWADKNDKKIGANIPVAYDTLIEYLTCVAGPNNTSTAAGNLNRFMRT